MSQHHGESLQSQGDNQAEPDTGKTDISSVSESSSRPKKQLSENVTSEYREVAQPRRNPLGKISWKLEQREPAGTEERMSVAWKIPGNIKFFERRTQKKYIKSLKQ